MVLKYLELRTLQVEIFGTFLASKINSKKNRAMFSRKVCKKNPSNACVFLHQWHHLPLQIDTHSWYQRSMNDRDCKKDSFGAQEISQISPPSPPPIFSLSSLPRPFLLTEKLNCSGRFFFFPLFSTPFRGIPPPPPSLRLLYHPISLPFRPTPFTSSSFPLRICASLLEQTASFQIWFGASRIRRG